MVMTQSQALAAYQHILGLIAHSRGAVHPTQLALDRAEVRDISDFISLSYNDIQSLEFPEYSDDADTPTLIIGYTPLGKAHKNRIIIMIDYYRYRAHIGNPIGDNWLSVTQEQYDEFRISPEYTEL